MKTALCFLSAFAITIAVAFHSPRQTAQAKPPAVMTVKASTASATVAPLTPEHEKFLADNPWARSPRQVDHTRGVTMAAWGITVLTTLSGITLVCLGCLSDGNSESRRTPVRHQ